MPTWTREQKQTIEDRGGQLLVSAAAGSGKTTILVERVVGMLCDPAQNVKADRLLIVTFTKAAAAELRGRLASRLTAELHGNPGSTYLRRQRLLLQRAAICTIDSYCLDMLHTHFAQLDIPPDFETADEPQLFALRQTALATVLERAYADPDFCAFADLYGQSRTDGAAEQNILRLADFMASLPDGEATLEDFCALWESDAPLEKTVWGKALLENTRLSVEAAAALNRMAQDCVVESELADFLYGEVLVEDGEHLLRAWRAQEDGYPWDELRTVFAQWKWGRRKTIRKKKGEEAPDPAADPVCVRVERLRNKCKDKIKQLRETMFMATQAEFTDDRRAAAPLVRALARATLDYTQTYLQAKLEEKVLEFSDIERFALRLLRTRYGLRTALADQLGDFYAAVMVDEYQDTNALQDALYHSLARPDGSNLFFVGDIKQSVYRFRQADPQVFREAQEACVAYGQGYPALIPLDANFRSAPNVVDSINYFFENLMSPALGGVVYGPGQALVAGVPGSYPGGCECILFESGDAAGDASAIARRIQAMLQSGFAVRDGNGGTRPVTAEDFCILLRGRRDFDVYAAQLEALHIPVYADSNSDLLDAPQVRGLAALLRVIDNPSQDISLAAAMLSGLFGFEPDDLLRLRAARRKGSLYGALAASEEPALHSFYNTLCALRRAARTLPVEKLLEEILLSTGYMAAVGAMPDGLRRRRELEQFVAWAGTAGKSGLPTLVRAMDAVGQTGGLVADGGGQTKPGCVSIMTVHRSKGLEFPVVFVAQTGHQFNRTDMNAPVLLHRRLGLGLKLRAPGGSNYATPAYYAVGGQLLQETLSEEMRILYVALTRAKDLLVLTGCTKDATALVEELADYTSGGAATQVRLQAGKSWLEWLLLAALRHPQAEALRRIANVEVRTAATASQIKFDVEDAHAEDTQPPPPHSRPTQAPDMALCDAVVTAASWHSPREKLRDIPAKVSVTGLLHEQREITLERPAFLYKEGLTGAEKGTALHAFLQAVNFTAMPDVPAEAARQKELGLLDAALYAQLDVPALEHFFAGAEYAHIRTAKRIYKECDFITAVPAALAMEDKTADFGDATVLVQGVADLVLVFEEHAEILDYKTDHGKTAKQLVESYKGQLWMYRAALQKRLGLPITRLALYSFALGKTVEVPLL